MDRIGVPWLHVLNEHPSNLRRYKDAFDPPRRPIAARRTMGRLGGIAGTLLQSILNRENDPVAEPGSVRFPVDVDVLLISHLVSAQADPGSADFYYGRLPEELASAGLSSIVALQDQLRDEDRSLAVRLTRGGMTSRIVLPRRSTLAQEGRLVRRATIAASSLRQDASAARTVFAREVALEAARHAGAGSTIASLRFHGAVKQLCERFRPRAVIVLWEGHAWERLAFHAARAVDPAVRCIGYQHAILFPRAHALKRSLGPAYDPDVVLTIGDITRDDLKDSDGLRGIPILVYGSHRRMANAKRRTDDASTRCLVVPDGIESECMMLFEFALTAAAGHPELQFVLRTHPVLPFEQLAWRHSHLRNMPANVRVSDQADIAADFARCDWALYRGSSAAVHAVLAGARPIYLEHPGELRIDPLFAMEGWRRYAATVKEFGAVVAGDRAMASHDRQVEWEPARAFCDRYVALPDPGVVRRLLSFEPHI